MCTAAHGSLPVSALTPLLAAALVAATSGCSSNSGGGSGTLGALRHMGAAETSRTTVAYVDSQRARELSKRDAKRFSRVGQPGSALLNQYAAGPWGASLNAAQIDVAVDTNVAGHWEGHFDADAIIASLKKGGFTSTQQNGKQVWKPSHGSGPALVVWAKEITYSATAGSFSAADPSLGASLADRPDYKQAAGCLGDVYRADFNTPDSNAAVRLSVLGQQADSSAKNTEVLCAVVKDQATADRLAAKLRAVVTSKAPKYDGTKVTVGKGDHPVVRASVPDSSSQQAGRLLVSDVDLFMAVGAV
ncbi:hypothetical protein [Streptomyces sp. NPDC020917]|uniref:hypothetical protein n=1 Tax=Streptomyces sp. NPDC020917 TaxID=3365102 RepID=UPI0037A14BF7